MMTAGNLDRRRFLRMASLAAMAGTGLAISALGAPPAKDPPVLIIGAGMAGVSAAFWLRQFGIGSIILEGRNRLGGRIDTSYFWPDAPLDLGAAWIHDSANSPLTALAKLFNIGTYETNFFFEMFGLQNQLLPYLLPAPSVASIAASFGIVLTLVENIANALSNLGLPDQPLGNVVNYVLDLLQPWNPEELAGVQTFIDEEIRSLNGAELKDLSLYNWNKDKNVVRRKDLAFPKGYVQLVKKLADASGQLIQLNCQAHQIAYDADGVTVSTSQGFFRGKYAIVTMPIGVLQKCQGPSPFVKFDPPLPNWKLGAINRLGMGVDDKLVLRFPVNFWGDDQLLHNMPPAQTSEFTTWFNPAPMVNLPIILALSTGDFAKKLETLPDAKVVSMMMGVLKPWFAAQNPPIIVPNPIQGGFQRSTWGSEIFSFGSFPYIPPNSGPVDYDIMSLPVPFSSVPSPSQRLFFAGDGTHRDHPKSVWGAYESGLREAFRILLISLASTGFTPFRAKSNQRFLRGRVSPSRIWGAYERSLKTAYRVVERDQTKRK